jgi:transposase
MVRQMERSAIHVMAKRGKSLREIGEELGHSPTTIARVLREPMDRAPAQRRRQSQVDPYRDQIEQWLTEKPPVVRMLQLARSDPKQPYTGSRSQFGEMVRRIRQDRVQEQAVHDVPIRFEGLAGEYLQVDWGEIRRFPFTQRPQATRYFLCCRLKYSRWTWIAWTRDMRQETLIRGLVDCYSMRGAAAIGVIPGTIFHWLHSGVLQGEQIAKGLPWKIPLTDDQITELRARVTRTRRLPRRAS